MSVLMLALLSGCGSLGGSYEKHYHNDLSNGQVIGYDTNGVPQVEVNGGETYERHWSYDLNPFVWIRSFFGLFHAHVDSEVVVAAPAYPAQYQMAWESAPVYSYVPNVGTETLFYRQAYINYGIRDNRPILVRPRMSHPGPSPHHGPPSGGHRGGGPGPGGHPRH